MMIGAAAADAAGGDGDRSIDTPRDHRPRPTVLSIRPVVTILPLRVEK